jgi:hypothetical protein
MAAIIGVLPNIISDGQPIDAVPVMNDFNYIVAQVNSNVPTLISGPTITSGTIDNAVIGANTPVVGNFTTVTATTVNSTTVNSTTVNSTTVNSTNANVSGITATTHLQVGNTINFYNSGIGGGYINASNSTYGMFYQPSIDGSADSHTWVNALGNGLMYLDPTGNLTTNAGITATGLQINGNAAVTGLITGTISGQDSVKNWGFSSNNISQPYFRQTSSNTVIPITPQSSSLGLTQSWSNAGKSAGITYTNSGTAPIYVSVVCTAPGSSGTVVLTISGLAIAQTSIQNGFGATICGIVPPGAQYLLTCTNCVVNLWSELK